MARSISPGGFAVLQSLEGYRAHPLRLGDSRFLVGHGHVRSGPPAEPISEAEAAELLRLDLAPIESAVHENVLVPLEQSQFDALVLFAFSIGSDAFLQSEALQCVNAGDLMGCAEALRAWRFGTVQGKTQPLLALARRRALEAAMLLNVGPPAVAPSAQVRPCPGPEAPSNRAPTAAPVYDELAERLRRILAAEPATARALEPPPPEPTEEEDEPLPPSSLPAPAAHVGPGMVEELADDRVALSALLLAGVVIVLIGFGLRAGIGGAWGDAAAALLGAPGGLLTLSAAYFLILPLMRRR